MDFIFYAKCKKNTGVFKTLIEILAQNSPTTEIVDKKTIKQACFKITKDGLEISSDLKRFVTTHAFLKKTSFDEYFYNDDEPLCIGISMDILKNCFKYVHKTDEVNINIKFNEYGNFPNNIEFIQNQNSSLRNRGFCIKFNIIQNIVSNELNDYKSVLIIPSPIFLNLYKELGGIKKVVTININNNTVMFSTNLIDIATNWVTFSKISDFNLKIESISLKSEFLKISSKMSNFSDNIEMALNINGNILLKTKIYDDMGHIFITILNLSISV